MAERIVIVGGGLAGLTLGIGLRQQGLPVTLWETRTYPQHRVCGEFISGHGQGSLARLGLLTGLQAVGVANAETAAFYDGAKKVATRGLPESALCISRFVLDAWLAREFQRLGGELQMGVRWTGEFGQGIARASGRRAVPVTEGWRLFGLKAHARNVSLEADLEMHFVPSGYVGLCRLPGGEVNVCGLFRSEATVPDLAQRWRDWLSGPASSALHARLAGAHFQEDSFCSVAGLCLRPRCLTHWDECCVGDALTMIPPVTGNGMSMAFESAELAVEPLAKFSRGKLSWDQARAEISARCTKRFASRLRWASWLQKALFQPSVRAPMLQLASHSEWLWRGIFNRTR